VKLIERIARISNRIYDRIRHPKAFTIGNDDAVDGDLGALRGKKYAVLVTFRRTGEAVPSPVWFGVDDAGRAYTRTLHNAGKVKRIRNNPLALIAPSTVRGKPTAPAIRATARVLPKEEWPHAEEALAAAYGVSRKLYEGILGGPEEMGTYIEISPRS